MHGARVESLDLGVIFSEVEAFFLEFGENKYEFGENSSGFDVNKVLSRQFDISANINCPARVFGSITNDELRMTNDTAKPNS
jgi:hypothetical protein